jgi:hypothetical protein
MSIVTITALIVAITGLVTAAGAVYHSLQTRRIVAQAPTAAPAGQQASAPPRG